MAEEQLPGIAVLTEAAPLERVVLRAGNGVARAIAGATGLPLDMGINRAVEAGTTSVLKLGPDEWLLLGQFEGEGGGLARRLAEASAGAAASIVDVSQRQVGLVLTGPAVEPVLAAGCPLPLDRRAYPVGRATRTLLGKAEIVLWRRATDSFHIDVARSFAPYLSAFLATAITDDALIASLPSR
ncbi:MAG: sarcosine oxidase subunit gamma [Proteobacteria bacterium]|nr:sarcosine oxidase subunit gamma [Pseudomonadota bacterium]